MAIVASQPLMFNLKQHALLASGLYVSLQAKSHSITCINCRLAAVGTSTAGTSMSQPMVSHVHVEEAVMATAGQAESEEAVAMADATPDMGTCDPKYWSCPGAAGNKVRGLTYLKVSHPALQLYWDSRVCCCQA